MTVIPTLDQALSMSLTEIEADGSYPIERELSSGESFQIQKHWKRINCTVGTVVTDGCYGKGTVIKAWALKQQPWFPDGFTGYTVLVSFADGFRFVHSGALSIR